MAPALRLSLLPCGRRWPSEARSDEGVPAWQRRRSVQHPSTVSALRADPPSPTRGEGQGGQIKPPGRLQNSS
ncbi:MAG: hypothetical protein EOR86_09485 [Mesorhizobium sp.]|nr:MAG: hypothetical protein EOR86_09485 [Mesorhizobium sp.]